MLVIESVCFSSAEYFLVVVVFIAKYVKSMDETFQATAGFQDSDFFHKAVKMVLRCILSMISHLQDSNLAPGKLVD